MGDKFRESRGEVYRLNYGDTLELIVHWMKNVSHDMSGVLAFELTVHNGLRSVKKVQ
jgi:hypothetical protein